MFSALVSNPSDVPSENDNIEVADMPSGDYDYIIVTMASFVSTFQALADFRASVVGGGHAVAIITVEDIYANYSGVDKPEKIRNCIRDYVNNHNTTYVCLGGSAHYSTGQVPVRYCPVTTGSGYASTIPTDLYYMGLDGTWDANSNGVYGESGVDDSEIDMMPDVFVGRIVVDTTEEATNYINKLVLYESNLASNNIPYDKTMLMGGHYLWNIYYGDSRPS